MANVRVYTTKKGHEYWKYVADFLSKSVPVDSDIAPADVSIVLSGRFINPLILNGKKVLAFDAMEWLHNVPLPIGFDAYRVVLEEYYDDFIDLTGLNVQDRVDKILTYIRGENG